MATGEDLEQTLCRIALRLPDIEPGIACAGTRLESRTFGARGKAFLFVRAADARLKLRDSLPEARRFAAQAPACCQVGASGWVKLLAGAEVPPREVLARWVAESHRLVCAPPAQKSKPKSARR